MGYVDYQKWMTAGPARGLIDGLLNDPAALYPEYVSRDAPLGLMQEMTAGADKSKERGRYLTLEIWLQQVFNGRYRPGDGGEPAARDDDPEG